MGWLRFLRRTKWDRERLDEIESYIQIETDENIARGMPNNEARRAAQRKLGNTTLVREEIYRMNTIAVLETVAQDIRHGWRLLRRSPTFTVVALLTLAIGTGANTAVFSVVNSVLLRPLPYPKAEELVAVAHTAPGFGGLSSLSGGLLRLSPSMFVTYSEHNHTFQAFGIWTTGAASVTGLAEPERVRSVLVSDGVLRALDVPPVLGRWLSPSDHTAGSPDTVMLGYGYWQRRFGGDRSVIGRKITADSRPREIVGVMPQAFRVVSADADLFVPLTFDRSRLILPGFGYQAVARLKPGATIAQAESDIARLVPVWMNSWPAAPGINPRVYEGARIAPSFRPLKEEVVGNVGEVLWVLMATIAIVMLIASANVANLMLVRSEARQQELAVRAALGAGRGRLVRGLLLESMSLAWIGGALGLGLAHAGLRLLVAVGPGRLPRLNEISVDGWALAFTAAVSLLAGLMSGLIPAWRHGGTGRGIALRGAGRTVSQSRERSRARNVLVVAQVALASVLLVSAGLMIRTFQALGNVHPGFTEAELQTMRISIPGSLVPEPERVIRMQNAILEKLAAIPGVTSAAFTTAMPMEGLAPNWDAVTVEGKPCDASAIPPMRVFKSISPGLLQTAGTRLIAGRDYTWTDLYGRRPVVMVSENLARELWGSPSAALGRRIYTCLPKAPLREVVGVVEDVYDNGVHEPPPAVVYWPSFGESAYFPGEVEVARTVTFAIRTGQAGSQGFVAQLSQAVWSVNGSLPLASVRTMQEVYDQSMARTSFALAMLGIAGAMALLLGTIGIYGVISYAVSQRTREIGIRLALGAQPRGLRMMFVRSALLLAGLGVATGLGAAVSLMRLMKSLLFGISPLDPLTYFAVSLLLVSSAVLASYVPARRTAAVDPVEALKME